MAENTILQPSNTPIKPQVTQNDVKLILDEIYGFKCLSIKELNGYDDNNYLIKIDLSHQNKYIDSICENGYVLKIINTLDSKKPDFFEAQNAVLFHLGKKGINCPKPIRTKNGEYFSIRRFPSGHHIVRLLEFIKGITLHQVSPTKKLFYRCGEYVARLDQELKDFHHPAYDNHCTIWMMQSIPQLSHFLFAVTDNARKTLIAEIIDSMTQTVLPKRDQLESGIIHGDFNEQNVIVEEKDGDWDVKAILDFGDSNLNCYLFELAITMAYMLIHGKSLDVGRDVLEGYTSIRCLTPEESSLLKICIAARISQSLVIGAYAIRHDPDNSYILTTSNAGWEMLKELWAEPEEKLLQRWGLIQ